MLMTLLSQVGLRHRRLLIVAVITVTVFSGTGTALATFMSLRAEINRVLDEVEQILDHPAIRPLA